jgi:hypothetical protein
MPGDPKECRKNATRCAELASKAADAQLQEVLNMLARRWVQLATELERAEALRDELKPSGRKSRPRP